MSKLPAWWAACSLADIGHIVTGKTPSTKEASFYGGSIPFIRPGDLNHSGPIVTTEIFLTNSGAAEVPNLPPQSIVVTCIGNLGKVGLTTTTSATNQQINALIPDTGIDPSFVYHYCKTLRPWLEAQSSATTISIVNKSIFSKAPIPLPPAAEQTRIAAKLDELLAQVDTLKARIDSIPALLKRFRQSVLAYAVSGQLTEEWRSSNELASPTVSKFEDLLKDRGKLSYGVLKPGDADPEGVPMVRVMDIGEWGRIDRSEIFKISKALSEEYKRTVLEEGDILLSVMATIGRAAIVPESLVGGNVNRALAVIKLGNAVSAEFAFFQIMSPQFQLEFVEKQLGSAQRRINLSDLREFTVLVPVREEQAEIVRRVEQLFAFADQLETRVKVTQARINHLTQSILAKAFRGELVPQEPTDEPASVLLERIKAQRTTAPKAKRGRRAATLE